MVIRSQYNLRAQRLDNKYLPDYNDNVNSSHHEQDRPDRSIKDLKRVSSKLAVGVFAVSQRI
jgi:uncharacterized C2H2 Zn-finger protein